MGNQNRESEKIPVLVKGVAAAVFALFLIPLLIFTALPNMFFGNGLRFRRHTSGFHRHQHRR